MSKRFVSEYVQGDAKYGSDIYAASLEQAECFAFARGCGEKIVGEAVKSKAFYPFPSDLFRKRKLTKRQAIEAVHGVTFLAWLAMKSGRAFPDEVLGDTGFLHEAIHAVAFGRYGRGSFPRNKFVNVILRWERAVPGFRPAVRTDSAILEAK